MHGLVTLTFGDGDYDFRLTLAGLAEIEEKRKASIFTIAKGLSTRTATSLDIIEVIRVGLIGGGMLPIEALRLVRLYVDQRPLDESRDVALAVTLAGLARVHSSTPLDGDGDDVGEMAAPISTGSMSAPS